MNHCLVIPTDMEFKLDDAAANNETLVKWNALGIHNTEEMLNRIVSELNRKNPKLSIISREKKDKEIIKNEIENSGNVSKFAGYLKNEKGNIDGLFFYIEPNVDSANDFLSRYVMPVVLGIYKSIEGRTSDFHINTMPVYIVSVCTTSRVRNNSVKKNIILAETMGFHYIDVFNNLYLDIIGEIDANGDPVTKIKTLQKLDDFICDGGINEYFTIDEAAKTLIIQSDILDRSSNQSAELYRYVLRVIPAVYLASSQGYRINAESLERISAESVLVLNRFLNRF